MEQDKELVRKRSKLAAALRLMASESYISASEDALDSYIWEIVAQMCGRVVYAIENADSGRKYRLSALAARFVAASALSMKTAGSRNFQLYARAEDVMKAALDFLKTVKRVYDLQ